LPPKYSPIQADGSGNQGAYLSEVNPAMADVLKGLLGAQWNHSEAQASAFPELDLENEDEAVAHQILQRTDIGATERQQLVKARRGQGVYRKNLEALESGCRVTGLTERRHLRASHIKPWRLCTDFEKLDGNNGLLLSPHLDHLFDQGFIPFEDEGALLIMKG
jgi:predicted restriction endonuclease